MKRVMDERTGLRDAEREREREREALCMHDLLTRSAFARSFRARFGEKYREMRERIIPLACSHYCEQR